MRRVINFLVGGAMVLGTQLATAQSVEEARMSRDIAVAENVLSTLIKQEFSKRSFFPVDVRGSYRAGYGITFTVPTEMLVPMVWGGRNDVMILDGNPGTYSYSFSTSPEPEIELSIADRERDVARTEKEKAEKGSKEAKNELARAEREEDRLQKVPAPRVARMSQDPDSLQAVASEKIVAAAKNFIADYGDMLSMLKPNEKIIITNKSENSRWSFRQQEKRLLLSIEALKSDLAQFKQGKISRDQLIAKIKVTNTESSGKLEPDLELLTSIFNRLYRSDLSKNFFVEGSPYYERLNDFGAIVYMQVYSSNQVDVGLFNMPTVDLREVDQATRDKKVKEMYPQFESELKENILEYGRTVKSLKDNEQLVFNVVLTKCKDCGIPSDLELTVLNSVLKEYGAGKIDKNSALSKIKVKKGADQ